MEDCILQEAGIRHELTVGYAPEQNGNAERMNRTIIEKARSMLFDAKLSKKYWAEAISTAAYLINRTPTRADKGKTPEEVWTGKTPNLKYLRIFGCKAMVHVSKQKRQKWDAKSQELIFVGFCDDTKDFRFLNKNGKVTIARDATFLETSDDSKKHIEKVNMPKTKQTICIIDLDNADTDNDDDIVNNDTKLEDIFSDDESSYEDAILEPNKVVPKDDQQQITQETPDEINELKRSQRTRKQTQFYHKSLLTQETDPNEPQTAEEAVQSKNKNEWLKAMVEEYESLKKNNTWTLVEAPRDKKILNTKWVFKKEINQTEKSIRYKARLVVKGCAQTAGIDYKEIYSLVVKYSSLRMLFAIATKKNLNIDHMDIKTAYLHGDLAEEIYVKPPKDIKIPKEKVWRLNTAVYGLKQSGRT